jgi:hypothetical protein
MSAARDKVIGSTIRNTAEMLPTATGKRRINSEVKVLVAQGAPVIDQAVELEIARVPVGAESQEGAQLEIARVVVEQGIVQAALEQGIVQAAAELGIAPVVAELGIAPVVAELEQGIVQAAAEQGIAPVEVELEHVQGEAELELVRAAVPLRTKSVIAAHHRGLVPDPGAADLAAEVETTREPVAAEAVIAWEVADTVAVEEAAVTEAVAAAVVVAAVAVVAVVEDGDKHSMRKNK